jgi:hypothetical protein
MTAELYAECAHAYSSNNQSPTYPEALGATAFHGSEARKTINTLLKNDGIFLNEVKYSESSAFSALNILSKKIKRKIRKNSTILIIS